MPSGVYKRTAEHRTAISEAAKGRVLTDEHKAAISRARKGQKVSNETRAKMSIAHKAWWTDERKAAQRALWTPEYRTGLGLVRRGEDHPYYKDGLHSTAHFALLKSIRERDGYKCVVCGAPQAEFSKALHIHHIDEDRNHSDPSNLVSLCPDCHGNRVHKRNDEEQRTCWRAFLERLSRERRW